MADLGAIGKVTNTSEMLNGGTISGVVRNFSGAFASHLVRAYHRESGDYSGGAYSSPDDGSYTIFTNISKRTTPHFVVEFDTDNDGDQQNMRGMDLVTPL